MSYIYDWTEYIAMTISELFPHNPLQFILPYPYIG